ncbi:hypothetical protein CYLTODRAFT_391816 [Cylindrobasidium torrendii FP15055 ss-10]|uniref:Pericentrin/AKAP-450 centrosomal targeting domain-containing protein n=1 Tax=Cylindrobasidium torrendii FP15055 ss-10 TaxID=1314674 RepID=A0A0D7BJX3_9AGAR|nr:hypothetical protein CYLTODRAFT_391816 [Cylindrobasidium torrendii FP15055 ss-10]
MAMLTETPSRIWRRIESVEDRDMPSLPSLPGFDNSEQSMEMDESSGMDLSGEVNRSGQPPFHSTPAAGSNYASSLSRTISSTGSSQRFANSLARSRSTTNSRSNVSRNRSASFDVSPIPSLPDIHPVHATINFSDDEYDDEPVERSKDSVPDAYLPPDLERDEDEDDMSFSDPESPPHSAHQSAQPTPRKYVDTLVPLRSEPKASPLGAFRLPRPSSRTRTPSLTRTTASPASSPSHSTPQSTRSFRSNRSLPASPSAEPTALPSRYDSPAGVPLPRSVSASPAVRPNRSDSPSASEPNASVSERSEMQSMDITAIRQSLDQDEPYDHQQLSIGSRDPTFSDQEEPDQRSQSRAAALSPVTPALPRRARFELDESSEDILGSKQQDDEPLTPHTRRKSFLLSIVNSTTRPRMKMPTPHARHRTEGQDQTIVPATPGPPATPSAPSNLVTPNPFRLQNAFAGATPLPRPRLGARSAHPLTQAFTPTSNESDSDGLGQSPPSNGAPSTAPRPAAGRLSMGASPAMYEDRTSFISTASSHDLTTNIRANTSFDPAMGFGVGGQATGRFNAGKLNTYLHGLNRRLQEENEVLIDRIRSLEESRSSGGETVSHDDEASRHSRRSSGGRRSSTGTSLGDVPEDADESWLAEKAELEEMVEVYKDELEKNVVEREEFEKALEAEKREREELGKALDTEKEERVQDQERWKARMSDVEKGVEGIISDLEGKLRTAEDRAKTARESAQDEVRQLEMHLHSARSERDLAMDRAEKAEKALSGGLELGGHLKEANQRISNLMGDLRQSEGALRDAEVAAERANARADSFQAELKDERDAIRELEQELTNKMKEVDAEADKVRRARVELDRMTKELTDVRVYVAELEESSKEASEHIESQAEELQAANHEIEDLKTHLDEMEHRGADLENELRQSSELAQQQEEALDAAEQKMEDDEKELARLKGQVAALQREKERTLEASRRQSGGTSLAPADTAEIEALEEELDDAHREIARLNTILNSSPVRKTMDKAKDMRIDMLEKENEALLERVKASKYNTTVDFGATPSRMSNISARHISFGIRTPKTPGGPLKDLTWLQNSTMGLNDSPLVAEIARLRVQLDEANENVDDKMDKLEDAGLGVISLTKKLEDARARIIALEEEISRLNRKDERRTRRLQKARCQKCLVKVKIMDGDESSLDLSHSRSMMASEPPTPPTRTSDALKSDLRSVNDHLATLKKDWERERQKLINEKGALEDMANKLNDKIRAFSTDAAKASQKEKADSALRSDIQTDLDKARRSIAELEAALSTERAQIRTLTVEQTKVTQARENIGTQLKRTQDDMEDVKQQLQRYKKQHSEMEKDLRENANADQRARMLEKRVAESAQTIEQLRQERSLLANDHKNLAKQYSEASEQANRLRGQQAVTQKTYDHKQHQLDLYITEIDELKRALSDKADQLYRAEAEKRRVSNERSEVSRTVATLEADLRRVKKDAEAFGNDLKTLRSEKEKAESKQREESTKAQRIKKQAESQMRLLNEQVEQYKVDAAQWRSQVESHVCEMDGQQLSAIKLQHNKECKGLIVQIRYLKAKFIREATLRQDLVYQKDYLLIILGRLEKNEKTIITALARIGGLSIEPPSPPRRRPSLKTVATMLVFASRIRRSAKAWRQQRESRAAVSNALQDVRKRRMTST